eukprot:TRINITY_DN2707_c0_g1_i1.p1 TRINITY_DN2707_c0_g1~~TRINITY_DN2707_c0_g1_i1.p1  ORF type:complete len:86 (+),score=12.95 TRINITY_DN2707_c0_g1_i1:135-392(+)
MEIVDIYNDLMGYPKSDLDDSSEQIRGAFSDAAGISIEDVWIDVIEVTESSSTVTYTYVNIENAITLPLDFQEALDAELSSAGFP